MGIREKKIVNYLVEKKEYIFIFLITILAILVRISVFKYDTTDDYVTFLHPWYMQIKDDGGLTALRYQVGNYSITYQFFIALFTYLPGKDIIWYKLFSAIFDFILAISAGILAKKISKDNSQKIFNFTYAIVLFLPTVVFNSSLWAQCDSIYVSFILISIINLLDGHYKTAFGVLGIAIAFKLQTVFIIPFFILIYVIKNEFSCLNFFLTGIVFYICCIPGFIYGRSLVDPLRIYINQSDTVPNINVGYPNFSGLFGITNINKYQLSMLHHFLLFLALAVLCIGLMIIFENMYHFDNLELICFALWTNWTCVMFLPNMHERYGFLADLLLIIVTLASKNKRIAIVAIISIINSFIVYCEYVFELPYHLLELSYIEVLIYFIFSFQLFSYINNKKKGGNH